MQKRTTKVVFLLAVAAILFSPQVNYCAAPPTNIGLTKFYTVFGDSQVTVYWQTETEVNTAAFCLWRSETWDSGYVKLDSSCIGSQGSSTQGYPYNWVDTGVQNGKTYYYKLEDIDGSGNSTLHGPVIAKACPNGTDVECNDGVYCNGVEKCDSNIGSCVNGPPPCTQGQVCNEVTDQCTDNSSSTSTTVPASTSSSTTTTASGSSTTTTISGTSTTTTISSATTTISGGGGGSTTTTVAPTSTTSIGGASTTTTIQVPPPTQCITDADCDDGVYCNGVEKCSNGICVNGQPPCSNDQVCKEGAKQCWNEVSITANSLQKTIHRPLLRPQKCPWLLVFSSADNHFTPDVSSIDITASAGGDQGVSLDSQRKPFAVGRLIFIPICVEREASTGQWNITIKTDIADTSTAETIVTSFQVK